MSISTCFVCVIYYVYIVYYVLKEKSKVLSSIIGKATKVYGRTILGMCTQDRVKVDNRPGKIFKFYRRPIL